MAFLLSPLFLRIGMAIAVAIFAAACWYKVEHWCNTVCKSAQSEATAAKAENKELRDSIALTQKRATDMALLWDGQRKKADGLADQLEKQIGQTFAGLADRAKSIGAHSGTSFGLDAGRLFDSARSAAGGEAARPAGKPAEAAPAPAGSAEEFVVQMYEWAAICRSRVDQWQEFYAGLRASQPKE